MLPWVGEMGSLSTCHTILEKSVTLSSRCLGRRAVPDSFTGAEQRAGQWLGVRAGLTDAPECCFLRKFPQPPPHTRAHIQSEFRWPWPAKASCQTGAAIRAACRTSCTPRKKLPLETVIAMSFPCWVQHDSSNRITGFGNLIPPT